MTNHLRFYDNQTIPLVPRCRFSNSCADDLITVWSCSFSCRLFVFRIPGVFPESPRWLLLSERTGDMNSFSERQRDDDSFTGQFKNVLRFKVFPHSFWKGRFPSNVSSQGTNGALLCLMMQSWTQTRPRLLDVPTCPSRSCCTAETSGKTCVCWGSLRKSFLLINVFPDVLKWSSFGCWSQTALAK